MKRILTIFTTAFTPTGGLTTVMMNYYRAMNKENLIIDFTSTNNPPQVLIDEIHSYGSKYYKLPKRTNIITYFISLKNLCRNYDLIHIHANSATAILELQAAKWAGIKRRIIHNHSSRTQHKLLNQLLLPLYRKSYTSAIACSNEAGIWLYGKNNFTILHNAINAERFKFDQTKRNKIRHELKISDEEYIVGHVGKFMEAKNHPFLIRTFKNYHILHPNSRLLLVGDGELRPLIEHEIKINGISDSVILTGLRSDIPDLLQAMDIFLFPSIYEGMPLSVIEAQASGLPCIISNSVTNLVNIGKDIIQLSLNEDITHWVEQLDQTKYKLLREERSIQNINLIAQKGYNITTEAERLTNIYNKL